MEGPLVTRVQTLHKALIQMAESLGTIDQPIDLRAPKTKMSEVVHQMNNIYSKIAEVLGGYSQQRETIIEENNFQKDKFSDIVNTGDCDQKVLNRKLQVLEVYIAQIGSIIENFDEEPFDALKYMSLEEKEQKLKKLEEETQIIIAEINELTAAQNSLQNTYSELEISYQRLNDAKLEREREFLEHQSYVASQQDKSMAIENELTSIKHGNHKQLNQEKIQKEKLVQIQKKAKSKEMMNINRRQELMHFKKSQNLKVATKETMFQSKWQFSREYEKNDAKLDLLRQENEELERINSLKDDYEKAIKSETKINELLLRELKYFKLNHNKSQQIKDLVDFESGDICEQNYLLERSIIHQGDNKLMSSIRLDNNTCKDNKSATGKLVDNNNIINTAKFGGDLHFDEYTSFNRSKMSGRDDRSAGGLDNDKTNISKWLSASGNKYPCGDALSNTKVVLNSDFNNIGFINSNLKKIEFHDNANDGFDKDPNNKYLTFSNNRLTSSINSNKKFTQDGQQFVPLDAFLDNKERNSATIKKLEDELKEKEDLVESLMKSKVLENRFFTDDEENIFNSRNGSNYASNSKLKNSELGKSPDKSYSEKNFLDDGKFSNLLGSGSLKLSAQKGDHLLTSTVNFFVIKIVKT